MKGDIRVTPSDESGAAPGHEHGTAAPESASVPRPADPAVIAAEIQALRRGRGLRGDVTGRIGPLLLELAAGRRLAGTGTSPAAGSDAAEVRGKLAARLGEQFVGQGRQDGAGAVGDETHRAVAHHEVGTLTSVE